MQNKFRFYLYIIEKFTQIIQLVCTLRKVLQRINDENKLCIIDRKYLLRGSLYLWCYMNVPFSQNIQRCLIHMFSYIIYVNPNKVMSNL